MADSWEEHAEEGNVGGNLNVKAAEWKPDASVVRTSKGFVGLAVRVCIMETLKAAVNKLP